MWKTENFYWKRFHIDLRGTENISEIIELGKAIDYINNIRISNIKKNSQKLIKGLYEGLSEINDIILYGDSKNI